MANSNVSIDDLIVRQVSELVTATAAVIACGDNDQEWQLELHLYRLLAENCQAKADVTKSLMAMRQSAMAA